MNMLYEEAFHSAGVPPRRSFVDNHHPCPAILVLPALSLMLDPPYLGTLSNSNLDIPVATGILTNASLQFSSVMTEPTGPVE
jgi:hypothetical protein